ncbi:hypothetical protein TNCV_243071 [Trichonephila clavipes]|uniref:Uncharacterized protein n=1 Tax=Trichonephila clavipes TaxID=2585209 RepID=A0A8X7BEU4_TRICX|nr:hypothetical protein TNCV_243071 [Trichonephila clavipes]
MECQRLYSRYRSDRSIYGATIWISIYVNKMVPVPDRLFFPEEPMVVGTKTEGDGYRSSSLSIRNCRGVRDARLKGLKTERVKWSSLARNDTSERLRGSGNSDQEDQQKTYEVVGGGKKCIDKP